MDITFFTSNLNMPDVLIPQIITEHKSRYVAEAYAQYNPITHKVMKTEFRKDRQVRKPDPDGTLDSKGALIMRTSTEPVSRLPLAIQKLITSRATAFATAGKLTLSALAEDDKQKALYARVADVFRNNKLQYKNSALVQALYSQTEVAEIWGSKKTGPGKQDFELRCQIYSPADGYSLMPVFDVHRDLLAFALGYATEVNDGTKTTKTEHVDLYTTDELRRYHRIDGGNWVLVPSLPERINPLPNIYGKIPVVYYTIPQSIWADVQPLIERLETLISNFADTNDYNGSPILFAEGTITGMSAKGETGKIIEGTAGAKLSYVTWEHAPESIKLEIETLLDFIFTITQTPNISFKEMKGLGDISGVAYDRIMIDAHLKAKDIQNGVYGEGIQRRINFLIAAITALYDDAKGASLNISPDFGLFKINDLTDRIEMAARAYGANIVTLQQAVEMVGISDDAEQTAKDIEAAVIRLKPAPKPAIPETV